MHSSPDTVSVTRPPVVLLHGFLGTGEDWRVVRNGLSPRFDCHCPDLPGHGGNPRVSEGGMGSLEDAAHWLSGCLDDWQAPQCGLVGYSMGGRLALMTALRHPKRVSCLVLESASPGLKTAEERTARLRHDAEVAARLDETAVSPDRLHAFLTWWYDQPLFASLHDRGLVEELVARRLRGVKHGSALAEALMAFSTGAQPSLWEELPEHRIPTLLIVGERDRKYRFIAEEMAERCPAMAVEVFASCGHNVHLENPDGYTTAVRSFLCANA